MRPGRLWKMALNHNNTQERRAAGKAMVCRFFQSRISRIVGCFKRGLMKSGSKISKAYVQTVGQKHERNIWKDRPLRTLTWIIMCAGQEALVVQPMRNEGNGRGRKRNMHRT